MNLNGQTLTATSQLKKHNEDVVIGPMNGCCACYFMATRQNYTKTSSQMVQPWASLPTTTASYSPQPASMATGQWRRRHFMRMFFIK